MDFFLVGVLTVFALILGGILYWSQQGPTGKKGLPIQLDVAPETIVEMQLEEILEGKNEASPDGKSFHFPLNERDNYTELKESTPDDKKALSSTLLKRCIECLNATMTYDARVKIVYESYNNMVPREILAFLNGIKTELTDEIEAIKTEANTLKEGWGENIFKQAMDLTVGLQRRKEARLSAEEEKVNQVQQAKDKAKQKEVEARAEAARKQKEADRAFRELTGEAAPKNTNSNKKTTNSTSQKKGK